MINHDIRLLAFDIDGTLFTRANQVSVRTRQAIEQLKRQGMPMTLVSGRTYNSVSRVAQQIGFDGPLVAYNGAYVAKPKESPPRYCQPMEWQVIEPMLRMLEEQQVYTKVYINDTLYVEQKTEETIRFSCQHAVQYKETGAGGLSKLEADPLKIVVIEEPNRVQEVYQMLAPWYPLVKLYKEEHGIEMNHRSIHKASGLEQVCEGLGFDMTQVMAFGNEANDMEMIREVGIGVAMGNAVPALKETADFVTKSNDEDGIVYALQHYGLILP
jgi:Cof subfamily protein (haloacid dehalogenase superfamily)